jgi:hypothetical protein
MTTLTATIHEALAYAPPEHLELALAALIEARFNVLPKAERTDCARRRDPRRRDYEDTFGW